MLKKTLLILIGLINILIASAQTDTITYTECDIDTTPTQYDKLLKYFLVEKEDINHLWKFNAVDWGALNPSIAFEQRIKGRSSFEAEVIIKTYNLGSYYNYGKDLMVQAVFNTDYRYYYYKKKREVKGKQTNGFTGSYLFMGGGASIHSRPTTINLMTELTDRNWDFVYNLKTGIGFQRRLGSVGYADIKCGFITYLYDGIYYDGSTPIISSENYITQPYIDINLGIALKSLKRPIFK